MPPSSNTPVDILLVEDSPDDAALMTEALKESTLDVRVTLVEDGEEAIGYLRRQGAHHASRLPDLILLDLHLPRMNGHEVLAEIKQDPELRRIPVIVLTSSDSDRAYVLAYDLQANCCVSKPADQDQFVLAVKKIEHYWLAVASRVRRP
jgi:two-component system, chemotaxis family, response regulator Rcp1